MDTENNDNPIVDTTLDAPEHGDSPENPPSAALSAAQAPGGESRPAEVRTIRIVAIKFRDAGKLYDFDARDFELKNSMWVVVETDRGKALGRVVLEPREIPASDAPDGLKSVIRMASDKDLESAQRHTLREGEALKFCRQKAAERGMDMKLVKAEYLFDGSKIIFYFTADGRVDFRELVKDLAHHFHTRIEMRQIGVRDEAKLIGGIGVCGRELCCCSFLREFEPVSVKMAKEQGLALNPSKISGQCGRLLCCLGYEYEAYCGLKKGLPKCGRKVKIDDELVEVTQIDLLRQLVTIRHEDERTEVVPADKVRRGSVEHPAQGGDRKAPEKRPSPREGRDIPEQMTAAKDTTSQGEPDTSRPQTGDRQDTQGSQAQDRERKKKRRPRRRRKNRRPDGEPQGSPPGKPDPS